MLRKARTREGRENEVACFFSFSPFLRGEGWGEGQSVHQSRGESPSPELLRNSTSPRKRGEVKESVTPFDGVDGPRLWH
jgi:hypothetical protein